MKDRLKHVPAEARPEIKGGKPGKKNGKEVKPLTPMADIQRQLDEVRKACGARQSTDKKAGAPKVSSFN